MCLILEISKYDTFISFLHFYSLQRWYGLKKSIFYFLTWRVNLIYLCNFVVWDLGTPNSFKELQWLIQLHRWLRWLVFVIIFINICKSTLLIIRLYVYAVICNSFVHILFCFLFFVVDDVDEMWCRM